MLTQSNSGTTAFCGKKLQKWWMRLAISLLQDTEKVVKAFFSEIWLCSFKSRILVLVLAFPKVVTRSQLSKRGALWEKSISRRIWTTLVPATRVIVLFLNSRAVQSNMKSLSINQSSTIHRIEWRSITSTASDVAKITHKQRLNKNKNIIYKRAPSTNRKHR